MVHFLSYFATECSDLHLASRSAIVMLSLTFGLGISTEVAGDGQAQTEEDQTKFCHCLRHSTVTDAGLGQVAEGPSDNTTHYSAAKKTQTGRNTPKDRIVPFSFIKLCDGGKRKEKRTLEVLLDSFCSSAFPSSWELGFFKDTLIFLFFLPPKQLLGTATWISKENEEVIHCIKQSKAMIFSEVKAEL